MVNDDRGDLRGLSAREAGGYDPVIDARDGEIARLRELVKAAYIEGRRALWDETYQRRNWQASEACAALGDELGIVCKNWRTR